MGKDLMEKELIEKAVESMNNTYSPYSDYPVGATVLAEDGRIYTGCNIENSSYGATICAERTAIFKAVSEGNRRIEKIVIAAKKSMPYPCGMCRQVMTEFMTPECEVILYYNGNTEVHTVGELIPHSFVL